MKPDYSIPVASAAFVILHHHSPGSWPCSPDFGDCRQNIINRMYVFPAIGNRHTGFDKQPPTGAFKSERPEFRRRAIYGYAKSCSKVLFKLGDIPRFYKRGAITYLCL